MSGIDLVGIGNALVDILVEVEDELLPEVDLVKGGMTLVDKPRSDAIYDRLPAGIERSGGSCGNTMAGFASLGGRGAYIGKVRDDQFGDVFRHDMRTLGVSFDTPAMAEGEGTGRCLVLVSPDAERTMATYLGAANALEPSDVDAKLIQSAKVTYLEGYLFDRESAKEAFVHAAEAAHAGGREVSLSLSDAFCVDRHRDSFLHLVENHIDILFANEDEIVSLYRASSFDEALQQVRGHCKIACLTRGAKGSVVLSGEDVHVIDADPVAKAVDTTGAGDQYAAGFLFGYTQDFDLATAGRIASVAAAEVVSHYGARPEADLRALAAKVIN